MNLELNDEERLTLLRLVREELAEARSPMSPKNYILRALVAKLEEEDKRKKPRR
jgi:hypothetical protein